MSGFSDFRCSPADQPLDVSGHHAASFLNQTLNLPQLFLSLPLLDSMAPLPKVVIGNTIVLPPFAEQICSFTHPGYIGGFLFWSKYWLTYSFSLKTSRNLPLLPQPDHCIVSFSMRISPANNAMPTLGHLFSNFLSPGLQAVGQLPSLASYCHLLTSLGIRQIPCPMPL